MKIKDVIEHQKLLISKWESRIAELEDIMIRYPHEKMNYDGADWRPIEVEQRKQQVEESKLITVACEKQIPKPPELKVHPDYPSLGRNHYCECGAMFPAWERPGGQTNYCGKCGQRLK